MGAPGHEGDKQRFVICWNGLVYPAVTVGDKADLQKDVAAVIQADADARAGAQKNNPNFPFMRFGSGAEPEGESVAQTAMTPIRVCLLLRLGEGDLAAKYWKEWNGPDQPNAQPPDAYTEFSNSLRWAAFDRAICAHMRGDDQLALLSAQFAALLDRSIKIEIASRGPKPDPQQQRQQPQRDYTDVLPPLIEDTRRRLKEGAQPDALKLGERGFANRAAYVAALVKELDQVSARQMGQPGGVDLGSDPIVQALIACGDDAVDPLLDCLENDSRLTRSVHFWRDFSPYRMPIGVSEAAYVSLSGILRTSFFGTASTGDDLTSRGATGRQEVATKIRAYWKKYRGLSLEERWFRILADDQCAPQEWQQALANITQPVDVSITPGSMFGTGWVTVPHRKPGEQPKLVGDALHSKQNPSVLDLCARRIEQFDQMDIDNSSHGYQVASASEMALEAGAFDPKGALPILSKQLKYAIGFFGNSSASQMGESLSPGIARMAMAMARAGDRSGLALYADWVQKLSPGNLGSEPEGILAPLWVYADEPAISDAAKTMFEGEGLWNPMLRNINTGWGQDDLLRSPLLGLPSFRAQIQRGLTDKTEIGTIKIGDNQSMVITRGNGSMSTSYNSADPRAVKPGTQMPQRVCDSYAAQISRISGAPETEDYWSVADRDASMKACSDFLTRYAARLHYSEQYQFDDDFPLQQACHLIFTPLDHPASKQEADNTDAIFSLEGQGERRVFNLPSVPMKANWVTLKKYPYQQNYYDQQDGEQHSQIAYTQTCWVWQAEEVKINGQWQRFFGVVGPHEVERVPAGDVELNLPASWLCELTNGINCQVQVGESALDAGKVSLLDLKSPVPIHISLQNRHGVAQQIPTHLLATINGNPSIRPGVTLELTPIPANRQGLIAPTIKRLQMKRLDRLSDELSKRTSSVETAASIDVGTADLHSLFDIPEPGTYQLQIHFSKESGMGEGTAQSQEFELK